MANYSIVAGDYGFGTNAADTFTLSSDLDGDTDFSSVNGRGGVDIADFGAVSAGAATITKNPDGTFTVLVDAGAAKDSFTLSNFETIKFANATLDLAASATSPQTLYAGLTDIAVGATFGAPSFSTWNGSVVSAPAAGAWTISAVNGAAPFADVVVLPNVGVATISGGAITFASTTLGVKIGGSIPLTVTYTDSVSGKSITQTFQVALGNKGTDGNDTFDGTAAGDNILAGKGNDTLYGQEGADNINGGAGNDTIGGGIGDDLVIGDDAGVDGSDKLYGGVGDDTIYGGAEDVRPAISLRADAIGAAADVIWAGEGKDFVYGASGNDTIGGGAGDDNIRGGDGNDVIYGGDGFDNIYSDGGNDTIYGGADDSIDDLEGGNGNDVIYGGGGNDNLYGGNGNDTINGGGGDDYIDGDDGNDVINGDDGNDEIWSGDGADVINGGAGNDEIDVYDDDNEVDTIVFGAGFGQDIVDGFISGEDKLDVSAFNVTSVTITYEVLNGDSYAVIDLGNGNEILVEDFDGTAGNTLSQSDFIF